MRVRVALRWADLVRDLGIAVIVAVIIGLAFQHFAGFRIRLGSHIAFAFAGIWWGRWIIKTSEKKRAGIGRTGPSSVARDAKNPPD